MTDRVFRCGGCKKEFDTQETLTNHLIEVHTLEIEDIRDSRSIGVIENVRGYDHALSEDSIQALMNVRADRETVRQLRLQLGRGDIDVEEFKEKVQELNDSSITEDEIQND
jgi:hypothetical protein